MSAASVLFSWSPECLRRAVDEVRALESMYGDSASLDNDPTEVSNHHETVLELAESVLDAHESHSRSRRSQSESLASGNQPPDTHAKHDDPLCSVPALEVTIKMLGPRLRGGGVAVAVRLAPGYPLLIRAELHVQGNARVTVADLSFLKQAASAASVECALGETNAVAGVEAVRGALRELNERVTFEQNLESAESAERLMTSKAKELTIDKQQNKKKNTIARRLIWFHHIKAPGKRKAVQQWARELGLGGFCKPGYPGIVVVEGAFPDVETYVARLKQLTWKAMSVRVAEEEETEEELDGQGADDTYTRPNKPSAPNTGKPSAPSPGKRKLEESFQELPENGLGVMGVVLRYAGLEHLLQAALKQRTCTWTGGAGATSG